MIVKCIRAGIILVGLAALSASAHAACVAKPAAVDAAITATITAVRNNDSTGLLAQMSRDGVAFGTDGPLIAYATLSSQFASKTGRYCDLFACGTKGGRLHRLFVSGKVIKQVDAVHGMAAVFINGNTNDELDLSYRLNAKTCKWELTGIGAV